MKMYLGYFIGIMFKTAAKTLGVLLVVGAAMSILGSPPAGAAPACFAPHHWVMHITYRPGYGDMYRLVCQ